MFKLFKKKSKIDKLQDEYRRLLEESYKLSFTSRRESDKKQAEADIVLQQIESLKSN
ncbi:Lacal_2735 family protein [Lacinutrix sp. MedPE-SW]|uniref:Lacal_2735 family protein n=1 Tax=Lacinutrix sp. MedPE-SW TaxID=1860087 RepID=UPI0025C0F418|nr:Lacal_2735 family protein [Lacinutrix sp. MedPE-SW]